MKKLFLFLFGIALLGTWSYAQNIDTTQYNVADLQVLPEFSGGYSKMYDYILKSSTIPKEQAGKVLVSFSVSQTGVLGNFKIEKSASTVLDNEVLRILKSMPNWKPGKIEGKVVNVRKIEIPISFR
jgi:TonB family protein